MISLCFRTPKIGWRVVKIDGFLDGEARTSVIEVRPRPVTGDQEGEVRCKGGLTRLCQD